MKKGVIVTSKDGAILEVERNQPIHGIILIPDLDLVEDRNIYGLPFMKEFMESTGGMLHILDPSELLRMVQAAEMIASESTTVTKIMAFDYYLMERIKAAVDAGTLCIEILFRRAPN